MVRCTVMVCTVMVQGRGTKTAHMDMVHMGRFGSVGTLWVCGHAMPVMGAVVAVSSRIL